MGRTGGTLLCRKLETNPNKYKIYSFPIEFKFALKGIHRSFAEFKIDHKIWNDKKLKEISKNNTYKDWKYKGNLDFTINHAGNTIIWKWDDFITYNNCHFIITIRNPNDIYNSMILQHKKTITLQWFKGFYKRAYEKTMHYRKKYQNKVDILSLEDIIFEQRHFHNVLEKIGLPTLSDYIPKLKGKLWKGNSLKKKEITKPELITYDITNDFKNENKMYMAMQVAKILVDE